MQDFLYTPTAVQETLTPSVTINVPDTTQQASLADLFNLMSATMLQMANRVADLEAKLEAQAPTSIEETLSEFLVNSEFEDRVNELVEHHMRYEFDIDNHVDIADVVRDTLNTSLTISFDI
jgi:hypothetical protein